MHTLLKKTYTSGQKCIHFRPEVYALFKKTYTFGPKCMHFCGPFVPKVYTFCIEKRTRAHAQLYLYTFFTIYICLSLCTYIYTHCRETFKKYKHFVNIYLSIYIYVCIDICGSDSYMGCGFGRSDRENERESERGDSVKHFAVTTLSCCYV